MAWAKAGVMNKGESSGGRAERGVGESEPYIAGGGAKATAMAGIDGRAAQGAEAMEIFCRKTLCRVWARC